ncbi:MAG TPA: hypothetical protein VFM70_08420 [Salinimicrobium sp.]|nr:hypothetical protein [Salinimicrobium sp.]
MKIFFYLIVFCLFSCSSDPTSNNNSKEGKKTFLHEVTDLYNSKFEDSPEAEYISNKIKVGNTDNAVLLIDHANESFYMLKFEEVPEEVLKHLKEGDCEIVDLKGELVLRFENKTFYFSTHRKPKHSEFFKSNNNYSVYEISKHLINDEVDFKESDYLATLVKKAECKCVSIWSYETCDAGGEGSGYCSGSTCSVACNERYFACCQN